MGYALGQMLPLSPFETYHLCCAVIGFLGVLAAYRIGVVLGGPAAGFAAALFLILTPRYYGHIFNNPKDIPFAVFYLWSVFWILRGMDRLPQLPGSWIWKTGLAIGLTLGCRVAGLVLFFYLALFWGIRYAMLVADGFPIRGALRRLVLQVGAIAAVAYAVMLPFWPWALLSPLTRPFEAMGYFSRFLEPHFSFFDGQYVLNRNVPWYYISKWLVLTLPEFVLFGLLLGAAGVLFFALRRFAHFGVNHLQRSVLLWAAVFPIVYAALSKTPFYDGYRHMLFVVPPLVLCSAMGVVDFVGRLKAVALRRLIVAATGVALVWTLVYMVQIHPNQSVYFNHLVARGIRQASARYETDYWGNSFKQGLDWIAHTYDWDFSKRKLRVASPFGQLHNVMDTSRFEREEVYERADLYLGTTRFGLHTLVPGEVVHTVRADDVPLLYVVRPDTHFESDPLFANSPFRKMHLGFEQDTPPTPAEEADFVKQVAEQNLYYFVAGTFNNLAIKEQWSGNYEKAASFYEKALSIYPAHLTALYNYGLALCQLGKYDEVIAQFNIAYSHQARLILGRKILASMEYVLGECYLRKGDYEEAYRHLRPAVDSYPDDASYRLALANALVKRDSVDAALEECERVLQLSPNLVDAHVLLGQIYHAAGETERAREAYGIALQIEPENETVKSLVQAIETEEKP
ncbi:MAG: tetratricopeptide repeat protein [bacterium]|nr:tetratricopeptide repeat protein [bacterium]